MWSMRSLSGGRGSLGASRALASASCLLHLRRLRLDEQRLHLLVIGIVLRCQLLARVDDTSAR